LYRQLVVLAVKEEIQVALEDLNRMGSAVVVVVVARLQMVLAQVTLE
jgi:hypothetical protein